MGETSTDGDLSQVSISDPTPAHAGTPNMTRFKPIWDLKWPQELRGGIQTTEIVWTLRKVPKPEFKDDLAAAKAFLATVPAKSQKMYLAELERLYYWVYYVHKKPVSSFTLDDRAAFENFLKDPQPSEFWCSARQPGSSTRNSPSWRPFAVRAVPAAEVDSARRELWAPGEDVKWIDPVSGRARDNPGLSETSISRATRIICQFFGWLYRTAYLQVNPWWLSHGSRQWSQGFARQQAKHRLKRADIEIMRADDWRYVVCALDQSRQDAGRTTRRWLRLRCLMYWTFYINPGPMALAEAMDSDINWFTDGTSAIGIWRTITRSHDGDQPLWIPLNDAMATSYLEWKAACGFHSTDALSSSKLPVFQRVTNPPDGLLTRTRIHNLQSQLLEAGVEFARTLGRDHDAASRLQRACDSRLRHHVPTVRRRIQRVRETIAANGRITLGQADKYLFADSSWPKEPIKFEDCLTLP